MVHQHFMLVPVFTVTENVMLGVETLRNGVFLDRARVAAAHPRDLQSSTAWRWTRMRMSKTCRSACSSAWRSSKILYRQADILIFDEPTAVLTPQEVEELFKVIRELVAPGRLGHLHLPQAERGDGDRRPDHRLARWTRRRDDTARRNGSAPPWRG